MKSYPVRLAVTMAAWLTLPGIGLAGAASVAKDKPKTTTQPTGKDSKAELSSSSQAILDAVRAHEQGGTAKVVRVTGEQINWQVISAGGGSGSSTNYVLIGTVGQTAVGAGSSTNYGIIHGFLQNFVGAGGCCQVPGDADHSGGLDVGDIVFLVSYLFQGSGVPPPCDREGDADDSGGLDVGDIVFLVSYLFQGSGVPPPPC